MSYFLKVHSSTSHKIQTKAYIKNLRHASLQMGIGNICPSFQACKYDSKRDINVQKLYMKNVLFSDSRHNNTPVTGTLQPIL